MLYGTHLVAWPFIGIQAHPDDRYFYYIDNERLTFSYWAARNPRAEIEERRCVTMNWQPFGSGDSKLLGCQNMGTNNSVRSD